MSVQTSITHEDLEYKVNVIIPQEMLRARYTTELNTASQRIRLKGYRPGKVPTSKVEQLYGEAIFNDISGNLTQSTLSDAIKSQSLNPVNQPNITFNSRTIDENLDYTATFEVYPTITLHNLSDVSIKKPIASLSTADIKQAIESYRQTHPKWQTVERKSKKDDKVTIDFQGTIDGKTFPGSTSKNYIVRLGEQSLLPEFEKALLGHKTHEKFSINCPFPETYHQADLAGKTATFEVTMKQIEAPTKLPFNDDIIKHVESKANNLDELKQEIIGSAQTKLDHLLIQITKNRVFQAAAKNYKFCVPNCLVDMELNRLRKNLTEKEQGKYAKLTAKSSHKLVKTAAHNVRVSLVMRQIILDNKIRLDEARLNEHILSLKIPYIDDKTFLDWFHQDAQRLEEAKSIVLEDQVMELILSHGTIVEESLTLKEAEKRHHEEIKK